MLGGNADPVVEQTGVRFTQLPLFESFKCHANSATQPDGGNHVGNQLKLKRNSRKPSKYAEIRRNSRKPAKYAELTSISATW